MSITVDRLNEITGSTNETPVKKFHQKLVQHIGRGVNRTDSLSAEEKQELSALTPIQEKTQILKRKAPNDAWTKYAADLVDKTSRPETMESKYQAQWGDMVDALAQDRNRRERAELKRHIKTAARRQEELYSHKDKLSGDGAQANLDKSIAEERQKADRTIAVLKNQAQKFDQWYTEKTSAAEQAIAHSKVDNQRLDNLDRFAQNHADTCATAYGTLQTELHSLSRGNDSERAEVETILEGYRHGKLYREQDSTLDDVQERTNAYLDTKSEGAIKGRLNKTKVNRAREASQTIVGEANKCAQNTGFVSFSEMAQHQSNFGATKSNEYYQALGSHAHISLVAGKKDNEQRLQREKNARTNLLYDTPQQVIDDCATGTQGFLKGQHTNSWEAAQPLPALTSDQEKIIHSVQNGHYTGHEEELKPSRIKDALSEEEIERVETETQQALTRHHQDLKQKISNIDFSKAEGSASELRKAVEQAEEILAEDTQPKDIGSNTEALKEARHTIQERTTQLNENTIEARNAAYKVSEDIRENISAWRTDKKKSAASPENKLSVPA
ncbi:MAG: hypothetical protein NZ828_12800 [Alphaproteobacteria bacterium]|nr:hypothetical protein [Alphaproteobacteria bacterium]